MTNDQLNKIKLDIEIISNNITRQINIMNDFGEKMNEINNEEQPEEYREATLLYSQSKNQLTKYLLTVVDGFALTLLDVIEYVQSSPKAKLWVPEGAR